MSYETRIISAVDRLEQAKEYLARAAHIVHTYPEAGHLEDVEPLIDQAIAILKTARYERPRNKDCLNCSNHFIRKDNRLICVVKQQSGATVEESIVGEDGYCEEWY